MKHSRVAKIVAIAMILAALARAKAEEPVRSELIRLQKETGLTLASFYRNVQTVRFADRGLSQEAVFHLGGTPEWGGLSRDGTWIAMDVAAENREHLAVSRRDGSGFRHYPEIGTPYDICWSPDHSGLALVSGALVKLDLASGATRRIDDSGYLTSQCWSPNGKQVVYESRGSVRVYDFDRDESREIARGKTPTWSPDGRWIAFVENDGFYAVTPSGEGKKLLFQSSGVSSPLWWSPDSRFVAYFCPPRNRGLGDILRFPPAVLQLRVRRLADGSEDYVGEVADKGYVPDYQWITPQDPSQNREMIRISQVAAK